MNGKLTLIAMMIAGTTVGVAHAQTTADTALNTANWASIKADDAHHAIMGLQTEVDKNTTDIAENQTAVETAQTTATHATNNATAALKNTIALAGRATSDEGKIADAQSTANTAIDKANHAQQSADHANVNANQALKNTFNLSSHIAVNEQGIKANATAIEQTQSTVTGIQKQEAIQNGSRVQGMIAAKHNSEQANTQQQVKNIVSSVSIQPDHSTQITANREGVAKNAAGVQKLTKQQRIDSVYYGEQIQNLATNTNSAIRSTQSRVSDNTASINKLNSNFSNLKSTVDDNRKEANAGIAGATAIASMPQVKSGDSFMVSAGAGTFNSESAVAVGASFNAGDHTVIKAGVSADTQSDFGAGVGVGFSY